MSRAISREGFDELKNYLGVYLQQGRAILDSDWNENQDIAVSFMRRLGRESLGDGSPNRGFLISPVYPPPPELLLSKVDTTGMSFEQAIGAILGACIADLLALVLYIMFGPLLFFLTFPGRRLEDFENLQGFELSSPQGKLRIARDRPYSGRGFLRMSGHGGTVTVSRRLDNVVDLSAEELAVFRYRQNQPVPGTMKFFLEDDNGDRSVWRYQNHAFGADIWLAGFATPLDIRFRILTEDLGFGVVDEPFDVDLVTYSAAPPLSWTVTAGALPPGVTLTPTTGETERKGELTGTPTAAGTFRFTVQVTDADGRSASRDFELLVKSEGEMPLRLPNGLEMLADASISEAPTGTPADLTQIRRYGFELYQDADEPLVWDLDDLRVADTALERSLGENNFIIRGSEFSAFLNQLTLMSIMASTDDEEDDDGDDDDDPFIQVLLDLLNNDFELAEPSVASAGRMYVAGLPCLQVQDVLYTDQADPNDPPLTAPTDETRVDTVYLDVWTEPVTYVEDPDVREVALGGPDTSTRSAVRHRVRVAQGGQTPTGDGRGNGLLATQGNYTALANRLYRVEIETAGEIAPGSATFRWSEDNASTIQRVIEPVPPGSRSVAVEDASAFHVGDLVLLRKEFGAEQHVLTSVVGNVVGLSLPTGDQLATMPAAGRDPGFTTFALDDRPMLQRWNAFGVPIVPDPADENVSTPVDLNDGVEVQFGGRQLRTGDYWTFRTRYLAGDLPTGNEPVARIEALDFARPRGVVHHYATLATVTRDPALAEPDKIVVVEDRRQRVGNASTVNSALGDVAGLTGTATAHLGGLRLPPQARDSKLVVFWSGDLYLPDPVPDAGDGTGWLTVRASFYSDDMTDPAVDADTGKIQDRDQRVKLPRRPVGVDIPLQLMYSKSDTSFVFLPTPFVPTSVQFFAELDKDGFSLQLTNMQATVLELKKSF